ncbi:MAG: right-handed parallel beta-helix repeat-containing protein [Desulfurella sp.]|uniref:right-handed parallel beta-helix repeat-containing protein n=2 Tax=Desulfurella sp. TaxID=1962857 RepID=UPI003D108947
MYKKIIWIKKALVLNKDEKFKNTIFLVKSKVGIVCSGCNVIFENCKILIYRCKKANIGLFAQSAKVQLKRCFVQNATVALKVVNSYLTIFDSKLSNNKEFAINALNSTLNIENCNIYSNGFEILSFQASFVNSRVQLVHSKIEKGINSIGLLAKNSFLSLENTSVSFNDAAAMHLENANFYIKKAEIHDNSLLNLDCSEIYIENSKGKIEGSLLYSGKGSFVIYLTKQSCLKLLNSFVFDNRQGILIDRYSQITIYKTRIYNNAILEQQAQINADSSKLYILFSKVFNGFQGIYAQKASYIFLKNSDISKNYFPLCIYELSNIKMAKP